MFYGQEPFKNNLRSLLLTEVPAYPARGDDYAGQKIVVVSQQSPEDYYKQSYYPARYEFSEVVVEHQFHETAAAGSRGYQHYYHYHELPAYYQQVFAQRHESHYQHVHY